ncbi:hydrophobin [Collybia nuda]|uniref:Hydrophobin n=1 Tax=Collybia nuda TaxID=64659 RepID=A0A9P6CH03_9AGAR|nr:hydrophobin [Collybia nuda]
MFPNAVVIATTSLALSVAAAPQSNKYKCNTGSVQCCNEIQQSQSVEGSNILAIVGLTAQGLTGMVGHNCSPISAIGPGGGTSCNSQPVCCENNSFNGLVAIGCSPVGGAL